MNLVRLGDLLTEQKATVGTPDANGMTLLGVNNKDGMQVSRHTGSADLSRYKLVRKGWFAYNPMRINVGSIGWTTDDSLTGIISPDYVVFSCNERILPEYLWNFITSAVGQRAICENTSGSVRERLYFRSLAEICICLPPIDVQREMAARFSATKEVIAKIRKLVELQRQVELPQLRQSILQLAVQGQLLPRDSSNGPTVELSMEQLVGRENMKNGLSLTPTTSRSRFACVPISSLRDGIVNCSVTKPISISEAEAEPFLIRCGDIFVVRGNGSKDLVGRAGQVIVEPKDLIFPDLFIRLTLDQSLVFPPYFLVAWNSPALRERIVAIAKTTSGIWKINQGHIASLSIPVPPLAEQKRIVAKVSELLSLCDALEAKLTQVESTNGELLASVVSQFVSAS